MQIIKRDGSKQQVNLNKITARIRRLCYDPIDKNSVDHIIIAQKVVGGLRDGMTTKEIDELAGETCASMATKHPDYSLIASRIVITRLHKDTSSRKNFSIVMKYLHNYIDPKTGNKAPLVDSETYKIIEKNASKLDSAIIYDRDFNFDYFGFKTLEKSYLLKVDGKVAERPQHMWMRVAVGIHGKDIDSAIETYNYLSEGWFTHATPTLFNAGTPKPQLSSCFLIAMKDDSIGGIYDTLKTCAEISKYAGGIGIHIHNVRSNGSYIRGTNGHSNGLVPMLKVFNETARYVDQGGGKRKGSFAVYLEPWHSDIFDFLDLKRPHGKEELKARDLFYALWIPDLFMKKIEADENWYLMCPNECPGLSDVYGEDFDKLYNDYVKHKKYKKVIKARELWQKVIDSQVETGTPYLLYKDACNEKSNQKNLGTIKSSNLCTEIIEYTSPEEVAVCNLASIALPKFVKDNEFDFQKLFEVSQVVTKNLNKVIDVNYYPVKEAEFSNLKHRPIGIGVQGLADMFFKLRLPFDSERARQINKEIFETIYFGALTESCELAKKNGAYESYKGSPASKGILQHDMWKDVTVSSKWDWDKLREKISKHGLRNSLLLAPMPTASTAQILGNTECIEPITSNIYTRKVLSGDFIVVNKYLLNDLIEKNLWNEEMRNKLMVHNGSIQNIPEIPNNLKDLYRTSWEISPKSLIDMAANRGAFICQSQSLNLFIPSDLIDKLSSIHFYAWKAGLKTGVYYTRIKAPVDPIKFTVTHNEPNLTDNNQTTTFAEGDACNINDPDCESCGS